MLNLYFRGDDILENDNACVIVVEGLTKKYGDLVAVKGINFCVRQGEIFGFLGPNGAGKTSTVRMLCGLTKITSGEAKIYGYDVVRNHKNVKRIIGVVPESSNLYWDLTCLDNLLFCGEMFGVPREERLSRAIKLLKSFGLWDKRNVKFKNLSKGLKRRLTIAAALIHNPKILFMDEPTAGLDVFSKRMLWNKILKLKENGVTIFLTTHNVREAFEICDRIAIINKGRIVALGRPWELKRAFSPEGIVEAIFHPRNPKVEEISRLRGVIGVVEEKGLLKIITYDAVSVLEEIAKLAKSRRLDIYLLNVRGLDAEELFMKIVGGS
ncbi:MAG: daunorubicin ABC transporter ATP-binding protein [Desulfurococcales archaeon ex4484_217_2]|nr:MAG: daunorubicin ABC transporter ATP-binding protein [Desulfurococcales archaeon ex4484_217_2]